MSKYSGGFPTHGIGHYDDGDSEGLYDDEEMDYGSDDEYEYGEMDESEE